MRVAAPQMLWLLLILLPPLIGFLWWAWRKRQQLITQFISERLLGHLKVGVSPSRQKARLAMIVAAVILVVLALARPQWGLIREEARQRGLDIVVAIDTSNSMLAEDVSPNRLARAKLAALDLMRRARTDRLGLVAFAGAAFLQCPLTLDDAAFSQSVNSLDTKTISQGGTAIAEAIDETRKAFKHESDNHRVLVLYTDGEDQDSEAVAAAKKAAKEGMIIFTVGIGSPEGELLRIRDERGRVDYIRDENGNPVKSRLNEDLLKQIAQAARGFYLPLRGSKTMDTLYDQGIAPLPKSEKSVQSFSHYHERFQWFLAAAMALLVVEMFLPDRKRRGAKRSSAPAATTNSALAETVAILLLLALPAAAWGSPGGALREYEEGKYQDALKEYNRLLEKEKDDPRLHFNAGAAEYQTHQYDQAAREFSEALASPDLRLQQRSWYNLGNTMYRLGEQLPDAEKKQEAWTNSLRGFESALKLNQQDADAKFNLQFVKKQLEELKKQQSQSQKDSDKKQNQDKKDQDQKNQSGKDQKDKQDGQSQSQKNEDKDKSKQEQNSQAKDQAKEKSEQERQQEQKEKEQSQAGDRKNEEKQQAGKSEASDEQKEKSAEEAKQEAAMMAAGQMTPQQAKQLLDAQKDDEHVFQLAPPNKQTSQTRSFKNW